MPTYTLDCASASGIQPGPAFPALYHDTTGQRVLNGHEGEETTSHSNSHTRRQNNDYCT